MSQFDRGPLEAFHEDSAQPDETDLPIASPQLSEAHLVGENPPPDGGRPRRLNRRLPRRYIDIIPAPPSPVIETVQPHHPPRVILRVWESVQTAPNIFGLYREFLGRPSYDPEPENEVSLIMNWMSINLLTVCLILGIYTHQLITPKCKPTFYRSYTRTFLSISECYPIPIEQLARKYPIWTTIWC